jgi:hypothetical protein
MENFPEIITDFPDVIPGLIIGAIVGFVIAWKGASEDLARAGAFLAAGTGGVIGAFLWAVLFVD